MPGIACRIKKIVTELYYLETTFITLVASVKRWDRVGEDRGSR